MTGTVKWFDKDRGCGFLNAREVEPFVHVKDIVRQPGQVRTLAPGDTVEFSLMDPEPEKGPRAQRVRVLSRAIPHQPHHD